MAFALKFTHASFKEGLTFMVQSYYRKQHLPRNTVVYVTTAHHLGKFNLIQPSFEMDGQHRSGLRYGKLTSDGKVIE
jgi:hypothetical protein